MWVTGSSPAICILPRTSEERLQEASVSVRIQTAIADNNFMLSWIGGEGPQVCMTKLKMNYSNEEIF